MMPTGVNPHANPMQTPMQGLPRPSLPSQTGPPTLPGSAAPAPVVRAHSTPKTKSRPSASNLPAPPLDDVHAAFVEFRAKEEDKVGDTLQMSSARIGIANLELVLVGTMYLLSAGPREEHQQTASALAGMSDILECYEGLDPRQQPATYLP